MPNRRISVLIADDHAVMREGLRAMLKAEKDIVVVAEAETGKVAVEKTKHHAPKVVIMDLAMPELNGIEAMRKIRSCLPDTKFVVLTAYCDRENIDRCLELGAEGFVAKEQSYMLLTKAIREVAEGRTFLCPLIRDLVGDAKPRVQRHSKQGTAVNGLTTRELQVLKLVASGGANKQIAGELGISIKTVEKHRQQLMDKLDLHDTASLTRYAIAAGVIDNDIVNTGGMA